MYCGGGHLGFLIGILSIKFVGKMFQNASSLKPLGQLKPNCPGMIIGRSSTNFMFFIMIVPGQFGFNYPSGFREEAF
jgi:hypothetical protein